MKNKFEVNLEQWFPYDEDSSKVIGTCESCGCKIFADDEYISGEDGLFCAKECLYKFYKLEDI